MPKLTDAELGDLLRETFADHEQLMDRLPVTTELRRRRHRSPVLLAAAAVLAVVAGVLYGVTRAGETAPPAAVAVSEDGAIWGAAIAAVARRSEPSDGWQVLQIFGQGTRPFTQQPKTPAPVVTFSTAAKERIEQAVKPLAPVQWDAPDVGCTARRVATVTVGPVVGKADHKEVHVSIFFDCGRGSLLTYRIEKADGNWRVTGTVGGVITVKPVAGCPSASPRAGC